MRGSGDAPGEYRRSKRTQLRPNLDRNVECMLFVVQPARLYGCAHRRFGRKDDVTGAVAGAFANSCAAATTSSAICNAGCAEPVPPR